MNASDYVHDPDRLKDFLRSHGLTGSSASALLGADSRTIRRWTGAQGAPGSSDMPYTAWYTLHHIVTGKVPQVTPSTNLGV